ncbi:hypothetical protein LVB87_02370 [Lysobacter sp. KIS68-7]|uniref:EF-hand domain-containing protein n=1 Tax=Lysobacter sp. KIS68-7 TaxID=2904252 RepID=UPI001E455C75|nr:EF-hand domain-containing protein [Lysobacter sp. KIS68-7]UHQ20025.1 hypothetical protein LVB87_02370 [Lysobacter sp. KIS68-7]
MKARIIFASIALIAASSAFAQNAAQPAARPAQAMQPVDPDAVFAAWDKDKNGVLSPQEFRDGYDDTREAIAVQRLRIEFQRHDANHDGRLDAGEYAQLALVQRAGKNAPMLSAFDKDKNQSLDFKEYVDFIRVAAKAQAVATPAPKTKAN